MYIKHLVKCICWLPQFQDSEPRVFHMFPVFSELLENGNLKSHFAQCNNCDKIHRIKEVGDSVLTSKEDVSSLPKISEIKRCLPTKYSELLASYNCDVVTWQEVEHILNNKMWGMPVILRKENIDGDYVGKIVIVLGEDMMKIESFSTQQEED